MKKLLSFILSLCMVITLAIPGSANNWESAIPSADFSPVSTTSLTDEDFFIPEEVAYYVAQFFIEDMANSGVAKWDSKTSIIKVVPMYDETGEEITAYTAELTEGYVVVSAYVDMPSIILEWGDEGIPSYKNAKNRSASSTKVIYVGALDYYVDNGNGNVETVSGNRIMRNTLKNSLDKLRSEKNVSLKAKQYITNEKQLCLKSGISPLASDNYWGGYITDPLIYASRVYGGTWKGFEWKNYWENYIGSATTSTFSYRDNCCGPVAVTNLLLMYSNKTNSPTIRGKSIKTIFDTVYEIGRNNYCYDISGATYDNFANDLINKSFTAFSVNGYARGINADTQCTLNLTNIRNELSLPNRLMYIMLRGDTAPYGGHHLVGYAYNRIRCIEGPTHQSEKAFIKVCDGQNAGGRYLSLSTVEGQSDYWEVVFPNI